MTGPAPRYREVATAEGAWCRHLQAPCPLTPARTRQILTEFAAEYQFPVSAFVHGSALSRQVTLIRDPSITHGTPTIPACRAATTALARFAGWTVLNRPAPDGLLVGLGLREGYEQTAPVRDPDEVRSPLRQHNDWTATVAELVSARALVDHVRCYAEPALLITAAPALLPVLTSIAVRMRQHRFVVTDFSTHRTVAYST